MSQLVRQAVGAIVHCKYNPGYVIIVKKIRVKDIADKAIPPEWDIPKGGIAQGESKEEALWRELLEEVGSNDFHLVMELPFKMSFDFPPGLRYKSQDTSLFFLEYRGPAKEFKPTSDEIGEVGCVHADKMGELVKFKETIAVIKKIREMHLF